MLQLKIDIPANPIFYLCEQQLQHSWVSTPQSNFFNVDLPIDNSIYTLWYDFGEITHYGFLPTYPDPLSFICKLDEIYSLCITFHYRMEEHGSMRIYVDDRDKLFTTWKYKHIDNTIKIDPIYDIIDSLMRTKCRYKITHGN